MDEKEEVVMTEEMEIEFTNGKGEENNEQFEFSKCKNSSTF